MREKTPPCTWKAFELQMWIHTHRHKHTHAHTHDRPLLLILWLVFDLTGNWGLKETWPLLLTGLHSQPQLHHSSLHRWLWPYCATAFFFFLVSAPPAYTKRASAKQGSPSLHCNSHPSKPWPLSTQRWHTGLCRGASDVSVWSLRECVTTQFERCSCTYKCAHIKQTWGAIRHVWSHTAAEHFPFGLQPCWVTSSTAFENTTHMNARRHTNQNTPKIRP